MTTTTILGTICQSCAVLIVNADESALTPDALAACMATLEDFCAESGQWPTVNAETNDAPEQFRCYTCHADVLSFPYDLMADLPMHAHEAQAIARDWQSPGPIGKHLAALASGTTVAWPAVAADARATIESDHPSPIECDRLDRLAQWCEDQAAREAEETIVRVLGAQRITE